MCLFINTEPVLPVYCSHGSGGLLNKQAALFASVSGLPLARAGSRERGHPAVAAGGFYDGDIGTARRCHGSPQICCSYLRPG